MSEEVTFVRRTLRKSMYRARIWACLICVEMCFMHRVLKKIFRWSQIMDYFINNSFKPDYALFTRCKLLQGAGWRTSASCIISRARTRSLSISYWLLQSWRMGRVRAGQSKRCFKQLRQFDYGSRDERKSQYQGRLLYKNVWLMVERIRWHWKIWMWERVYMPSRN